jgi:hypothetical protein
MRRDELSDTKGQALILSAVVLTLLMAIAALAVNAAQLRAERQGVQNSADLAALAVAQSLPLTGSSAAQTLAQQWATTNSSGATATVSSTDSYASRIQVNVQKSINSFLPWLGSHETVSASATARSGVLGTGYWVAPLAVSGGSGCGRKNGDTPCIGAASQSKTPGITNGYDFLAYHHLGSCTGSSASFCFTDLSSSSTTATTETAANDARLGDWILHGYPNPVTVPTTTADYKTNDYTNGTGTTWCGHNAVPAHCLLIQDLQLRAGQIILVPVFDPATTKNSFSLISFAVFRLAPASATATGDYVLDPKDTAHWLILGQYLGNTTCQAPPTSGGSPPADFASTCYGTPGGSGSQDYGVGAISLVS